MSKGVSNPLQLGITEAPPLLNSEEEAINWVRELVDAVLKARSQINVEIPGNHEATVSWQTKAAATYYVRHGAALGALMGLFRSGRISAVCYNTLREEVIQTLAPSRVGVVHAGRRA